MTSKPLRALPWIPKPVISVTHQHAHPLVNDVTLKRSAAWPDQLSLLSTVTNDSYVIYIIGFIVILEVFVKLRVRVNLKSDGLHKYKSFVIPTLMFRRVREMY